MKVEPRSRSDPPNQPAQPPTSTECAGTVVSILDLNPRKLGSMEEFMVCLSQAVAARRWRHVLVFAAPPIPALRCAFEQTGSIIEIARAGGPSFHLKLARILRKYRPQIVHFHFFDQFSLLPVLAWLLRARLVVFTEHTRVPQPLRMRTRLKVRFFDRIVFPALETQLIAVSEHIKRTLVDNYQTSAGRIRVVRNGANLARFAAAGRDQTVGLRRELEIPSDSPVIVTAANLVPEKGIDYLLQATQQVVADRPDVVLVIVGDGLQEEVLKQQAAELGIQRSVRFTGLRSDVHLLMLLADIVAVPSVWQEPAGLVTIEGMAAGRPVVATRVGGIPEYLQDQVTGILVEPRSAGQLASALLRLLHCPAQAQAMGEAGRKRVQALFSMDRWVSGTLAAYAEVMGPAAGNGANSADWHSQLLSDDRVSPAEDGGKTPGDRKPVQPVGDIAQQPGGESDGRRRAGAASRSGST